MNEDTLLATPLPIIYEEAHFMLVNKPAGLFTQAAPGVPSLERQLVAQLKHRDQHPGNPFVGLPHRLDRATSGILLVARNKRALARFGQQFQSRKVDKYYLTVLEGELPTGISDWVDSMRKIPDQPQAEIVDSGEEHAKRAELRIEALAMADGRTLALVQLLTGRMHQIRLQAAHRGWPIVDDRLYGTHREIETIVDAAEVSSDRIGDEHGAIVNTDGDGDAVALAESELRERPHALHAYRLQFRHPQTAAAVSFCAHVPAAWSKFFAIESPEQISELVDQSDLLTEQLSKS